ncbi:MAG: hypothetical protein COA65_01450 [Rhodospirillaceae bacterium]|nr:MAG: hypothetical protein COA65_01450 [Rhodospirillaceae bacterium]
MVTTASDRILRPFRHNRLLQGLTALFVIVWLVGAIAPVNRFDWFLENLLVFVAVGLLGYFYRTRPLSDLSYTLVALFLMLHTVGSHYTYAMVPPGFWLQDALTLERNPFDRIIHFSFGVLSFYPVREVLFRYAGAGLYLSAFVAFTIIATSSVVYEIIEWIVAVLVSPEAAMVYLGTQGDAFDAQKDSALAIAGVFFALLLTRRFIKPTHAE